MKIRKTKMAILVQEREELKSSPFGAKFPADCSKHQGNDNGVEEANGSVLWVSPVREILLPKACQELTKKRERVFAGEVQLSCFLIWFG